MKNVYWILVLIFIATSRTVYANNLSKEDCDKKQEGWYVTGLPLINYTSDTGLGYGVRLDLYNNGSKSNDYFCKDPYLTLLYALFFRSTTGVSYYELHLDQYKVFGSDFRIEAALVYDVNTNANYFGIGSRTTKNKLTDIGGKPYKHFSDYEEDFLKGQGMNREFYKFNKYKYIRPQMIVDLYGDITDSVSYIIGFKASWIGITTWHGDRFKLNGHNHRASITLLGLERPRGFQGGWVNNVRFCIAFNTLDYEPDPKTGVNIDYSFETSQSWFASAYRYYRNTFGARYYITFFDRLTFASRIGYTIATDDIPFFDMSEFSFPYSRQSGLGGNRTLRGYQDDRFVGKTMTVANMEMRMRFLEITPWGERFAFKAVVFWDTGNAYDCAWDPFAHPRWGDYKHSLGGGLIIAWNQATIIHFYYAWSPEDVGISIDFDHAIQ